MKLNDFVQAVQNKPDGQYAILVFDIGICSAVQPTPIAFANNFNNIEAVGVRGPWMATSKNEMAQNTAVHTERMLLNQLPRYLKQYMDRERRRPYSLGLYSHYSPCRHCAAGLIRRESLGKLPELNQWGFKKAGGWNTELTLDNAFGLTFFNFKEHYVDAAKYQEQNPKSWYKSKEDSIKEARRVQDAGWIWEVATLQHKEHPAARETNH